MSGRREANPLGNRLAGAIGPSPQPGRGEKSLVARVFPGDINRGQGFVHLEDLLDALVLAVEPRKDLPEVTTLLIGEAESPSFDGLQRCFSRELHGKERKTYRVPKPLAKLGARVQGRIPGAGSFIKPWMIDRPPPAKERGPL